MLNPYQQRVHQKMAHSRILMGLASQCSADIPGKQKLEALLLSVVVHLGTAYQVYLKEIAFEYKLSFIDSIVSVEQLQEKIIALDKVDSAVNELITIEASGWLEGFLKARKQTLNPSAYTAVNPNVIAADSGVDFKIDEPLVASFLHEFELLLERQRHSFAEY